MDFEDWVIEMCNSKRGNELRSNLAVLTFVVQKRDIIPLLKCLLRSRTRVVLICTGFTG